MFLRFITTFMNIHGERETGVFQALGYLRRDPRTRNEDVENLLALRDWFDQYLEPPTQLTKRQTHNVSGTALGRYRDTAKLHIAKMYELKKILDAYGIIVDIVWLDDPGYIVYEDEYQVAAIPYRGDKGRVT